MGKKLRIRDYNDKLHQWNLLAAGFTLLISTLVSGFHSLLDYYDWF
jgi:hypothetical protein